VDDQLLLGCGVYRNVTAQPATPAPVTAAPPASKTPAAPRVLAAA
jgi:hypothetical protein